MALQSIRMVLETQGDRGARYVMLCVRSRHRRHMCRGSFKTQQADGRTETDHHLQQRQEQEQKHHGP